MATSIGGRAAANEVLSKNLGGDILKEHAIVTETALLEEAWRPKNNSTGADHVLDNFSVEEKQSIETVTNNIISSIATLIKKDLDLFSSQVNQK